MHHRYTEAQRQLTFAGVTAAFRLAHQGYSADRVIADPELNDQFIEACTRLGLVGDAGTWNRILLQLRKGGGLIDVPTISRTTLTWEQCDPFLFASEIALQSILDEATAESLDDVLCQPEWAAEFDRKCRQLAPGFTSLQYRWGALKLRKHAKTARTRGGVLRPPGSLGPPESLQTIDLRQLPGTQGVYVLEDADRNSLYVGATHNLKDRLTRQFDKDRQHVWKQWGSDLTVQTLSMPSAESDMLAWQSCFARRCQPRMNFRELASA